MSLTRRTFLGTTCGLGCGTLAAAGLCNLGRAAIPGAPAAPTVPGALQWDEYERILARTKELDCFGCPRSWSVVRQGFLPVSPERVMILKSRDSSPSADRWGYSIEQIRVLERLGAATSDYETAAAERGVSPTKVGLILRITENLARYYSLPGYWRQWAYWLSVREATSSTGMRGLAMPHQFQYRPDQTIGTSNARVDWWLVLIPGGTTDWDALDGRSVHAMLTHVFSRPHSLYPGDSLRTWCYSAAGLRAVEPVALSKMDRVSAARLFNRHVISALPTEA